MHHPDHKVRPPDPLKGKPIFLFAALLLFFCHLPGTSFGHDLTEINYGPGFLHIRPQAPGHSFRMTMPHILPGSIRPGSEYYLGTTLSNIWTMDHDANLDYEMMDLNLSISYGFNEHFGFALVYDRRDYFGGILDGLIQGIHDTFDLAQDGRTDVPRGRTYFERFDTAYVNDDLTVLGNSAVTLLGQYVFLFGSEKLPAAGISAGARYTLEPPEGDDVKHPVDYTVALGLAKRLKEHLYSCLHLSWTHFEQDQILGLEFRKDVFTGMVAIAWEISDRYAFLTQYFYNQGTVDDFAQFGKPSHELDFGLKVKTADGGVMEFAIIENILNYDNSPDLGLHFGYTHRL